MTRRAEAGKHTGAGQCVGAASWAERFPDWNPAYVAYALANGATDVVAFRAAQTSRKPFDEWAKAQEAQFRAAHGLDQKRPMGPRTREEFNRWLERGAQSPEHIAPIVDRVMAGILSRQSTESRRRS
jgi:hypothetical protein